MKKINAMRKRIAEGEEGFTLTELIIAIAIIGILVAIAIPVYGAIQGNARESATASSAKSGLSVAMANHHQWRDEAQIRAEVTKADTDTITHTVGFADDEIQVTAEYGNNASPNYVTKTFAAKFSASNENSGGVTPVNCPVAEYPYTVSESYDLEYYDGGNWFSLIANTDWRITNLHGRGTVCDPDTGSTWEFSQLA